MTRSAPNPRLPMNALRAFVVAAQHESFVLAAAGLNVTPAAISRHIRNLEDIVGHQLFLRHAQSVELTEFGRLWLPSVADAFNLVDNSLRHVLRNLDHRPMRILCQTAFATGWLMPRLDSFLTAQPEIDLRLGSFNEVNLADIEATGAFGAILSGNGQWPGMDSHFLTANRFVPVISPGYRANHDPIHRPSDLLSHRLIIAETNEGFWGTWFANHDIRYEDSRYRLCFPTAFLPVQAALHGLGVALADLSLISRELREGTLEFALDIPAMVPGTGWYLVSPPSQRQDVLFQTWSAWLRGLADKFEVDVPGSTPLRVQSGQSPGTAPGRRRDGYSPADE